MNSFKLLLKRINDFLIAAKGSPLTVLAMGIVAFFAYKSICPVPERMLIITETIAEPITTAQPTSVNVAVPPIQYVKYTIVCTPADNNALCDTAANIFQFIASAPAGAVLITVAGLPRQMTIHQRNIDSGRYFLTIDLPSAVSSKDSIEIVAPIVGTVGPRDLRFESPSIPNLLDGKMSCSPAQVSGGGLSVVCVETPTFLERLGAVFKAVRG
ncbi:MAG: hypothetical protein ABSC32_20915 [Steroidobacteraceae bacterium]|jgi:hypothetical protein